MYNKFAKFLKNNRKLILIIVFIFNILSIISFFFIKLNTDFKLFMPDNSPSKREFDYVRKYFPEEGQTIILVNTGYKEISIELLKKLIKLHKFLKKVKGIKEVISPVSIILENGLPFFNVTDINNLNIDLYKRLINFNKNFKTLRKYKDKYYSIFILSSDKKEKVDFRAIEKYFSSRNFLFKNQKGKPEFYITGDDYLQFKLFDYIFSILIFIPPIAILLIFLVFSFQIGALKATVLSVMPAGIAALWTVGVITILYKEISILSLLAPIFTIVIGSADGLHFMSHYLDRIEEGLSPLNAVSETLKMVGIPMVLTTITSIAGFLSLLVFKTRSITQLAISAGIGIFLAGIITWTILPAITTSKLNIKRKKRDNIYINFIKKLYGKPIIIMTAMFFLIFIPGIFFLKTDFNELSIFKKSTYVYKSVKMISKINKGSLPLEIFIKANQNILNFNIANKVFSLEKELEEKKVILKIESIYDIIAHINSNIFSFNLFLNSFSDKKFDPVSNYPKNKFKLKIVLNFIKSNFKFLKIENFVKSNHNVARLIVFPSDYTNKTLTLIKNIINKYNNKNTTFYAVSIQYLMKDLNDKIKANQLRSVLLVIFFIIFILFIYFKRLKESLLAPIPVLMSIISIIGFMGYSGISLSIVTSIMLGIVIGVGIDYAIHYISVYVFFKKQGVDPKEAGEKAFNFTATPIIANAMGLAIGLSALIVSPFAIHLYLVAIMWIGMLCSSLFTLGFLNYILRYIK